MPMNCTGCSFLNTIAGRFLVGFYQIIFTLAQDPGEEAMIEIFRIVIT